MGERRFVITEIAESLLMSSQTITESELKRRYILASGQRAWANHAWDRICNILLYGREVHGEGENGDRCTECGECHPCDEMCPYEIEHLPKTSPTPTREEWQKWIYRMPYDGDMPSTWQDAMQDWFLSMPIVPKD